MNQPHSQRGLIFFLIIVIVLGLGLILRIHLLSQQSVPETPVLATSTVQWFTYRNTQYGFEIQYPETWQVIEDTKIPGIHIYKKGDQKPDYLTHHNNFTHVSVYPHGIGTEGVYGETATSSILFLHPVKTAVDHVLENGVRWATYVGFENLPASWEEWGYVWAGTDVKDVRVQCQNGTMRTEGICEIGVEFENSKTIRSGSIDAKDRKIQEKILSTFTFTQ